jgi:hypothetical protein
MDPGQIGRSRLPDGLDKALPVTCRTPLRMPGPVDDGGAAGGKLTANAPAIRTEDLMLDEGHHGSPPK